MAKDAEVAAKVRTTAMMARKSRGDIGIDSKGGTEVLGLAEFIGTGGTGGEEDADDAGSGTVTDGAWMQEFRAPQKVLQEVADPLLGDHPLADPLLGDHPLADPLPDL